MEKSTGSFLIWEGSDWTAFVEVLVIWILPVKWKSSASVQVETGSSPYPLLTRGHRTLLLSLSAYCSQINELQTA